MKPLDDYLLPITDTVALESFVYLSDKHDSMLEVIDATDRIFAEEWHNILIIGSQGEQLGVLDSDAFERDLALVRSAPTQRGPSPDQPIVAIPPPIIYVCSLAPDKHPWHYSFRVGPLPQCPLCPGPCRIQ